jgi:heat shock protein HslJ
MKTITILLFAIILNACGASNKAVSKLSDDNMKNAQETLSGTFNLSKMNMENLTISFDEANSKVSGFSGCNNFFGSYAVNGNTISFKGIASTKKMCADKNSNLVESKILSALNTTTNFQIKDNKLALLNAKEELLTATKQTEAKSTQDAIKIEYRAHTRGSFKNVVLENKTVSVKNKYDGKPIVATCNDKDWDMLLKMVSDTNLETLATLEAPSKAHQYDGAAIANFTIIKDGDTYQTPPFDAGTPNKDIEPLVNLVIKIAEVTKEKN